MPKVSVIVPVYNVDKYLDRCVESILAQTFSDFELILIDDGSSDNSPELCDKWESKDERIRVIHQQYMGVSGARNVGLEASVGKYISFIDSDDWVHKEYLSCLLNAIVDYDVSVSLCGFIRTSGEGPIAQPEQFDVNLWTPEELYLERNVNAILIWGKMYKKECFDNIAYPCGKIHEDEFTTHRILFKYPKISFIEAPMYVYYKNPNGITGSAWNLKRLDLLDALFEQFKYFKANGFLKAQNAVEGTYLYRFNQYINKVKEADISEEAKKKIFKKYSLQLAAFLKMCKENYPIKSHAWYHEFAFPRKMYMYWTLKGIQNKFRRGK